MNLSPQFFINPFTVATVPAPLPAAPALGPDFPWWYEQEEDFN